MNPEQIILVVDDTPQSLGLLCSTLEQEGYTVLVARDGHEALARLDLVTPDAILLDAVMPGLSGFETCRRVKANPALHHVPVIFMTGLSETSHVVEGFEAGGVDYVIKPLRAEEVLARLATHVRNARVSRLARQAVDVAGFGVVVVDARGRMAWCSPQASGWMQQFHAAEAGALPAAWVTLAIGRQDGGENGSQGSDQARGTTAGAQVESIADPGSNRVLVARSLGPVGLGETMLVLQVVTREAAAAPTRLGSASLTPRETEVLSWLAKGKTNRDIGEILGMSPRTVNKHLEHVFEKLGVETRAAAAALASRELQLGEPQRA